MIQVSHHRPTACKKQVEGLRHREVAVIDRSWHMLPETRPGTHPPRSLVAHRCTPTRRISPRCFGGTRQRTCRSEALSTCAATPLPHNNANFILKIVLNARIGAQRLKLVLTQPRLTAQTTLFTTQHAGVKTSWIARRRVLAASVRMCMFAALQAELAHQAPSAHTWTLQSSCGCFSLVQERVVDCCAGQHAG